MAHVTRRSALTIITGGVAAASGRRAWAADNSGRVIYPVAVPVYQTQFVADRIGFFKEAGLDPLELKGARVRVRGWIRLDRRPIIDVTHPEPIERLSP